MGRPKGSKNRATVERETAAKKPPDAGTKEAVLQQTLARLGVSDAGIDFRLDPSHEVTQARVYTDGGYRARVMAGLARRAETARFPDTDSGVFDSLEEIFLFCIKHQLTPTLGLFAIWNGVTMQRVWQIENDHGDSRARAVSVCKECIRTFLEQSAIDATYNPLLYFNAMKSQYGLAENVAVTVRHEDNTAEITADEYQERVVQLTQGSDGVYREAGDTD